MARGSKREEAFWKDNSKGTIERNIHRRNVYDWEKQNIH